MKRVIDITVCSLGILVMLVPMVLIAALIRLTSKGPALYWSQRVGRNNKIFRMPKFRTMRIDTPQLATHQLEDADRWMVPAGRLLRTTSLDELPQLWSILKGDMSLVGPRPALFNQDDLVAARTRLGVDQLVPGLTGWAQINGRDELSIAAKVELDGFYVRHRSLRMDLKILCLTLLRVVRKEGIVQAGEQTKPLQSPRRAA